MKSIACLVFALLLALAPGISNAAAMHLSDVDTNPNQLEGYPIDSAVQTTRQRTIVPDVPAPTETVLPYQISKYAQNGFGSWHYGPGLDAEKRLDLMPTSYTLTSATNTARLLNFFAFSDIHITDKESPAQGIALGYKGASIAVYSPTMLLTTQIFDAAVQTINTLHQQKRFDFGMALGDACNGTQYNELRWYMDVLDGRNINPDSGAKDDPIPGPYNDYQDEYKAAGLDKSIPWYQVIGNHDHFWLGYLPPNDYLRQIVVGVDIINLGNVTGDPRGLDTRGLYMGALDGRTPYGDVIGVGRASDFTTTPTLPAADLNRRILSRKEWINEFFNTSSNPMGHGFNQANLTTGFACYAFEPKAEMPIKIIVLDDTQRDDDINNPASLGYAHPSLDKERYDWLVNELDTGQAEGKLMVIAAHEPIGVEPAGSTFGWNPTAPVTEAQLIAKLHQYPNLIMLIAGHRHGNTVTAFKSPDTAHPELGFWQIETASLREYPQQFRTFEIRRNSDGTISILATDVDPAVKDGSLAALSRSYGIAAFQTFKVTPAPSYNGEFVKQLSPEMQAKIQNYGTPIVSSCKPSCYMYH